MYINTLSAMSVTNPGDEGLAGRLRDQWEIVDVLYRFGLGQDLRYDHEARSLFESAFAEDAVLDFRPAARKCGLDIPLMRGRRMIADTILNPATKIHTTHVVSNPRIRVDGDSGRLTALVEAQHLPADDHSRHLLLKNIYEAEVVRDGLRWVMSSVVIENLWFTGDPLVILGR
jgi:hypothetical protein